MRTRLTIDLANPSLARLLRLEAAHRGKAIREIVTEALEAYFSHKRENRAVMRLAEQTFEEWDNPKDADYDKA